MDIYEESIALHRKNAGKISLSMKVPLENKRDLSLAYSPGVAGVSRAIAADPAEVKNLTIKKNTIAIVSDGSAILGLGNLGPEAAIPVMEGKAALFKRFADVDAFPICLATQDTEEIIETVMRIAPVFGGINLEDISAPRCFEIETRLRAALSIPVMHDDQHGTAVVVLAGLINALTIRGGKKEDLKVVMNGVGSAGSAITRILLQWGVTDIILSDSRGIVTPDRDDINDMKRTLAGVTNPRKISGTMKDAIVGADVFIGVSVGGILTKDHIKTMAKDPIIFALANPEPEIMPEIAKEAGALVVATGRSDYPNQVNNVLSFPGIFRGALDHDIVQFTDEMFIAAAEAIASCVHEPSKESVIPDVFDTRVAEIVASVIR
jgi:malate dehydrogenase (oxaloacetate-decarboxylating)